MSTRSRRPSRACAAAAGSTGDVLADLTWLTRIGLLVTDPSGDAYGFADPLVRDVAYATVSLRARAVMHEAAGDHLAADAGAAPARVDLLAHHYGRSSAPAGTRIRWIDAAARAAEREYATTAALRYLAELQRLQTGPARAEVLVRRAAVLTLVGRRADAEMAARSADEACSGSAAAEAPQAARVIAARARSELGHCLSYGNRVEESIGLLSGAADELSACGDVRGGLRALDRLAFVLLDHDRLEQAAAVVRRQLRLAREVDDDALVCAALNNVGLLAEAQGRPEQALSSLREALRRARKAGDRRLIVHTANDLAGRLHQRGETAAAAAHLGEAIETARSIGYRSALAVMQGNLADLHRTHGDAAAAAALAAAALTQALDLGDRATVANGVVNLALARAGRGSPREVERAARIARRLGFRVDAADLAGTEPTGVPVPAVGEGLSLPLPPGLEPATDAVVARLFAQSARLADASESARGPS